METDLVGSLVIRNCLIMDWCPGNVPGQAIVSCVDLLMRELFSSPSIDSRRGYLEGIVVKGACRQVGLGDFHAGQLLRRMKGVLLSGHL